MKEVQLVEEDLKVPLECLGCQEALEVLENLGPLVKVGLLVYLVLLESQ